MQEMVHKSLVELIYRSLQVLEPELARRHSDIQQALLTPHDSVPANLKIRLLDTAMEYGGSELIFALTEQSSQHANRSPLFLFLLNSESPVGLIQKLQNYDRYFHSTRHLETVDASDGHITVRHIEKGDHPPRLCEEIFVFSLLRLLLKGIGCREIAGRWIATHHSGLDDHIPDWLDNHCALGPETCWRFVWRSFSRPDKVAGLDDFLLANALPISSTQLPPIAQSVESIILSDLTRNRSINQVASALQMSPRTLQRKLKGELTSFSVIINQTRVTVASKLLQETRYQITEIGLMSGFSDGAHFSREFKRATGYSPREHRHRAA